MLDNMKEMIKDNQKSWAKIEDQTNKIKESLKNNKNISVQDLAKLLVSLVDHLRPMNPSIKQVEQMSNSMIDLFKNIKSMGVSSVKS